MVALKTNCCCASMSGAENKLLCFVVVYKYRERYLARRFKLFFKLHPVHQQQ